MSDRRLKVFFTVARLLNFTKAAETLHMTQPAVTFQIAPVSSTAANPGLCGACQLLRTSVELPVVRASVRMSTSETGAGPSVAK